VKRCSLFCLIKVLAIVGIMLAIYLLWQQMAHPSFSPCSINNRINCDAIISGAVSKTLGIPTPLYGLIGYVVIFFAAVFRKKKLLLAMATFGLVFCLYIAFRELFQLRVVCPICIGCQFIMILVFYLSIIVYKKKNR
jgi:uncharacterized membrane protein